MAQTSTDTEIISVVDRFWNAIELLEFDRARALLTKDAIIWHANDNLAQPARDVINADEERAKHVPRGEGHKRYRIERRYVFGNECLQQQVCELTIAGGKVAKFPMFVRNEVRDGKIARIDEWWDAGYIGKVFQEVMGVAVEL
jgi:ketosteroid isomerase-like protein